MNKIKKYAKERDEMLLKRSVAELKTFVNNHAEYYSPMFIAAINAAPDFVLEITLHKMVVHCTNLPFEFRAESADWLLERGFDLEVGVTND